ncbi:SDR family NAD(P)-dependent oxidoreductase [Amycolatopsis anabasis]|uniref:SDR family NAD(P)-dependent oxidoreductase n=1 Tax=Amycolatopsis anabasis TaxID=1840409 RepID=UPI00131B10A5|nr:SDR family NAD(P)-dependent oxidoreductase [Amycolatopsis anabasis]
MTGELDFTGRVAVVTGGGRGLGREHALLLAGRGAAVVVNDLGTDADAVVDRIRRDGGRAEAVHCSVGERAGADQVVTTAITRFGRLDIVLNNAGVTRVRWDIAIRVNLSSCFWLTQAAWPFLVAQGYGRIVNTTSAAGLFGFTAPPGEGLDFYGYGAAKMGVVGLTLNCAFAGEPHGIKVNAVAPVAHTRMSAEHPDPRVTHWLEEHFPAHLVSPVVAYLAHRDCPVTGQVITAGGGRLARVFVAETRGNQRPATTVEEVRDQFAAACALTDHVVPVGAAEETTLFDRYVRPGRHRD